MSTYSDKLERHYILGDLENKLKRKSSRTLKLLKNDDDIKIRREVANNNERRRMQSINAGFESLRKLLPFGTEKEKISKASILQSTAKYITDLRMKINSLENEIVKLSNSIENDIAKISNSEKTFINKSLPTESVEKTLKSEIATEETHCNNSNVDSNSTNDLSSSLSSTTDYSSTLINFNSEEEIGVRINSFSTVNESIGFSQQQQNNLEQLLAAVEQVERLEAMQSISLKDNLNYYKTKKSKLESDSNSSSLSLGYEKTSFFVMKPIISPFAEKIIQDVVNIKNPYKNLTTSVIGSNSFILPISCPTYIPESNKSNDYLQNSEISNNYMRINNVI